MTKKMNLNKSNQGHISLHKNTFMFYIKKITFILEPFIRIKQTHKYIIDSNLVLNSL